MVVNYLVGTNRAILLVPFETSSSEDDEESDHERVSNVDHHHMHCPLAHNCVLTEPHYVCNLQCVLGQGRTSKCLNPLRADHNNRLCTHFRRKAHVESYGQIVYVYVHTNDCNFTLLALV